MTQKTRIQRIPQRQIESKERIFEILDAGSVCHVAFVEDNLPYCIPTIYGRRDNSLFLHGSKASRMLKHIVGGGDVAITVTYMDALVIARSAFHHSMNYRSVCVFGKGKELDGKDKWNALETITEQAAPGRWEHSRQPSDKELLQTTVVEIPIETWSGKERNGPPVDDDADLALDHWAGLVPFAQVAQEPINAPDLRHGIAVPDHVLKY